MLNFILNNKVAIAVLALVVVAMNLPKTKVAGTNITASTVMVTNVEGTSGGSGSVIAVTDKESEVLTNAHVCKIMVRGGMVTTTYGRRFPVTMYKADTIHDLCIVVVLGQLVAKASIASSPAPVYEKALTSGHPSLLPNILTDGYFAENRMVNVFTGVTPCTKDDELSRPDLCIFFGGIPIIKNYMATVVSTLIMPGSSGSGVYNSKQELTNVIFAGGGELSFAFAVPNEYVVLFTSKYANNQNRNEFDKPSYITAIEDHDTSAVFKKVVAKCLTAPEKTVTPEIKQICRTITKSTSW